MASFSQAAQKGTNALLRRFRKRVQLFLEHDTIWYHRDHGFEFRGEQHLYFVHQHNCGWPPGRMTERCVEMALADRWLNDPKRTNVIEIGAVTPYYWPKRVESVVDPGDDHPLVTSKTSMMDLDLVGRHVLAISTLEHVGSGEYGQPPQPDEVMSAFRKLFREAEAFLVTVPLGYNPTLDRQMRQPDWIPGDVSLNFLVRSPEGGNQWHQTDRPSEVESRYGPLGVDGSRASWANAVAVFQREA